MLTRLYCWWFGCEPDYQAHLYIDGLELTPCARCGAEDCTYNDMVGYTRHARFVEFWRYWLWRKWVPRPCVDCGKRGGNHDDCIPF